MLRKLYCFGRQNLTIGRTGSTSGARVVKFPNITQIKTCLFLI